MHTPNHQVGISKFSVGANSMDLKSRIINPYGMVVELVDTRESQKKWVPPWIFIDIHVKNPANSRERVNLGVS